MKDAQSACILAWAYLMKYSTAELRAALPKLSLSVAQDLTGTRDERARAWAEALIEAGTAILHSREIAKGARPT